MKRIKKKGKTKKEAKEKRSKVRGKVFKKEGRGENK